MRLKDLIKIFSLALLLFAVHLVLAFGFNIYHVWPPIDLVMHFLGGVAVATGAHIYLKIRREQGTLSLKPIDWFLFIVMTVALAAVSWEILEFAADKLIYHYDYFQPSNNDTMKDLIMGLSGGTLTALFIKKKY